MRCVHIYTLCIVYAFSRFLLLWFGFVHTLLVVMKLELGVGTKWPALHDLKMTNDERIGQCTYVIIINIIALLVGSMFTCKS